MPLGAPYTQFLAIIYFSNTALPFVVTAYPVL